MIQLKHKFKIIKGADTAPKLMKMYQSISKNKQMSFAPWGIVGKHLIKHAKDDFWRGYLVQTFNKIGIDLSKYMSDKTRIPDSPPLDHKRVSLGLRGFALPNGNRIELKSVVPDPDKLFADILNDPTAPMAEFFASQMRLFGLKPEGGTRRGGIR